MCWKYTDAYSFDVLVCTIKFQHILNAPEHKKDKNTDRCNILEYLFVCLFFCYLFPFRSWYSVEQKL